MKPKGEKKQALLGIACILLIICLVGVSIHLSVSLLDQPSQSNTDTADKDEGSSGSSSDSDEGSSDSSTDSDEGLELQTVNLLEQGNYGYQTKAGSTECYFSFVVKDLKPSTRYRFSWGINSELFAATNAYFPKLN